MVAMQLSNFKITIEYDGSGFHGWQRQKGHRTVQEEIENALHTVIRQKIAVIGSGRTDAGVHALGQVASFKCHTRLGPGTIQKSLNSLLPDAIVIRECKPAAPTFHARYDAKSKTYRYRILNHPLAVAVGRQYAWHLRRPLDLDAMRRAAAILLGPHDFSAFEGAGSPRSHAVRQVFRTFIDREEKAEFLAFASKPTVSCGSWCGTSSELWYWSEAVKSVERISRDFAVKGAQTRRRHGASARLVSDVRQVRVTLRARSKITDHF